MNKINILLVEDEVQQQVLLKKILVKEGYLVEEAKNGKDAINKFTCSQFDIVLLDYRLPDITGFEVLQQIKTIDPIIPAIIITAFASIGDAVKSIKEGAFHYLTKPVNPDELCSVLKKAVETLTLKRENEELKKSFREKYRYEGIIYASGSMEELMSLVFRAAKSEANILITGESGTGKELVAGAIHNLSPRKGKNFVSIHLAAFPETIIETELFGHEKGAFTGADKMRTGRFEFASGGTIFLDEIGELPQCTQVKILRVIQERKIVRLGANEEIPVDIRLICATNKDIEEEMKKGGFCEALYYRLNVIRIHIPPLRKRKEDIPLLVDHFIRLYSKKENKPIKGITGEAMKNIIKYDFPGNIRELQNIIERAVVFARGEYITKEDLPVFITPKTRYAVNGKLNDTVEKIEKEMIVEALRRNVWNQTKAALELEISERVLRYKLKKYRIKKTLL
ncbi:MAG: sigma-54 dependent transcriptional regulator [bacterium]|nr:sigma-54 dependent transcriptional regulator [bacterium]